MIRLRCILSTYVAVLRDVDVENVLYVPELHMNLLSVRQLWKQNRFKTVFGERNYFKDIQNGRKFLFASIGNLCPRQKALARLSFFFGLISFRNFATLPLKFRETFTLSHTYSNLAGYAPTGLSHHETCSAHTTHIHSPVTCRGLSR